MFVNQTLGTTDWEAQLHKIVLWAHLEMMTRRNAKDVLMDVPNARALDFVLIVGRITLWLEIYANVNLENSISWEGNVFKSVLRDIMQTRLLYPVRFVLSIAISAEMRPSVLNANPLFFCIIVPLKFRNAEIGVQITSTLLERILFVWPVLLIVCIATSSIAIDVLRITIDSGTRYLCPELFIWILI